MAWEDRTPFDAIEYQFGLTEKEVIVLMRSELKNSSWKRWRKGISSLEGDLFIGSAAEGVSGFAA